MINVKAILEKAIQFLKDQSVENPEKDARILFTQATCISQLDQICNPENLITQEQYQKFWNFIERRSKNEPISHILGEKEFWSLAFKVTKDTLAPRPDSEVLIEAALKLFTNTKMPLDILDLGTGSGCLIVSLLSEFQNAQGVAVDISLKTLKIAEENAIAHKVQDRLSFVQAFWTEPIEKKFDLIVSNPPYIPKTQEADLQKEVVLFDPHKALFGGDDGLDCYRQIASKLTESLKEGGIALLEIGFGQKKRCLFYISK